MDRRRLAMVLAGLVLVGGAVAALRLSGGTPGGNASPPPPPLPTVIHSYVAQGVIAPQPGSGAPGEPSPLVVTPGPRRLQVTWNSAAPGGPPDPAGAAGYYVRWGAGAELDHELLVAEPDVQLNGLTPGQDYGVEVQTVNAFGQRSTAREAGAVPQGDPPAGADDAFVDHFTGSQVPDPTLWRLTSASDCAEASRGSGGLMLLTECGRSSAVLRARTPLRLNRSATELGRFTIDTDAPGESGELDVDLVSGPVSMIADSPNDPISTTPPGVAAVDGALPPGTVRVRIAAGIDPGRNEPDLTVQVAAAPGTPTVPRRTAQPQPIARPRVGMSVRWDIVLRTDGIQVLRNGRYVGGGNVVPAWNQATALVEFSKSAQAQQRFDVRMIGFGGAPTSTPPAAPSPQLTLLDAVDTVRRPMSVPHIGPVTGPGSALLLLTVVAKQKTPNAPLTVHGSPPEFRVAIGGDTFVATPAVRGTPFLPQTRYPLVARVPGSTLGGRGSLQVTMTAIVPAGYPASIEIESADLDVSPGGPARRTSPTSQRIAEIPPQLAVLSARVLDANGNPPPPGRTLPRGRAVLDVSMDAVAGQRVTGQLAGLAGFEVWLDNAELVAVPTATDGPAVGGEWRIAFNVAGQAPGPHTIDVRAFAATRGVAFDETFTSYNLGP
jgi:hypothetical protein